VVCGGLGLVFSPLLLLAAGGMPAPALLGLFLTGFSGGIFFVPLYSLLQERCPPRLLSRTVAVGCILDALFMVVASLAARALTSAAGLGDAETMATLGALAFVFLIVMLLRVPELLFRFRALLGAIGGIDYAGRELVPAAGPVVLVCRGGLGESLAVAGGLARRPRILVGVPLRLERLAARAGIEGFTQERFREALLAGDAVILGWETEPATDSLPGGTVCLVAERTGKRTLRFSRRVCVERTAAGRSSSPAR
jgi:hypothetical protein